LRGDEVAQRSLRWFAMVGSGLSAAPHRVD